MRYTNTNLYIQSKLREQERNRRRFIIQTVLQLLEIFLIFFYLYIIAYVLGE
jgi:hypothetical protein